VELGFGGGVVIGGEVGAGWDVEVLVEGGGVVAVVRVGVGRLGGGRVVGVNLRQMVALGVLPSYNVKSKLTFQLQDQQI
jgi:hypothetical protein